jgi:hypothetical protein
MISDGLLNISFEVSPEPVKHPADVAVVVVPLEAVLLLLQVAEVKVHLEDVCDDWFGMLGFFGLGTFGMLS